MPFATSRVGPMAPPSRNDGQLASVHPQQQQNGGGRSARRQKGITMEDLKKQTAMRLAQEHHQVPPGVHSTAAVAGDPRTRHPVVTPQLLAARRMAAAAAQHAAAPPVSRDMAAHHYQRLHHHQHHNPMVHHIPNTVEPSGISYGTPHYYDQGPNKNPSGRHKNPRQAKFAEMQMAEQQQAQAINASNARFQQEQQQRSQFLRPASAPVLPANPLSSSSSAYNSASGNLGGGNTGSVGQSSSTSKLPHGLTVHELKEMTKARLQAEAADKMSMSSGSDRPPSATVVEIEARDSGSGGFDAMQSNYGQSMPSLDRSGHDPRMVPAQVQTSSLGYDQGFRQPAQVSPIPHSLPGFGPSTSSSSFNDTLAQDVGRAVPNRGRVDSFPDSNWDNASVTSHNSTVASEYLGSESAFSSGVNGFAQLDDPSMSLGRTHSYPLGSNGRSTTGSAEMASSRENTPTSSIPSPIGASYFEPSGTMSQNRQRAMTLSPRPGLSLLHEDRPGFCEDELGIPNFSSGSRHARQQLTARSRRSFSPILQPQAFASDSGLGGAGSFGSGSNLSGIAGGHVVENRARTSSTVSLPAISHTAEEFALDPASSRRSSDNVSMRGQPINEYSAISHASGTDGLLGSSSLYNSGMDGRSAHTSSVFRNDYGGIPAPPGLGHDNIGMPRSGNHLPASRAGSLEGISMPSSNRGRAATWAATPATDMFASTSSLYDYGGDDTLAGDLASILKLSGAEEKEATSSSGMLFSDVPSSFLGKSRDF